MEASYAGKRECGAKEGGSSNGRVWADGFRNVTVCSRVARVLKLMNNVFLCAVVVKPQTLHLNILGARLTSTLRQPVFSFFLPLPAPSLGRHKL
jgi:hypothetical protein